MAVSPVQKRQAKALLSQARQTQSAYDARAAEVLPGLEAINAKLEGELMACNDSFTAKLQEANLDNALDFGLFAAGYLMLDMTQETVVLARPEMQAAILELKALKLADPVLRRFAAAKARQLELLLALPDLDSCATLQRVVDSGFSVRVMEQIGEELPGLTNRQQKALSEGVKRLRQFGLTAKQAAQVHDLFI
jgi:hypothetical protein